MTERQMIIIGEEGWKKKKKILIILAHPDDPEFFMGATITRWVKMGHSVHYVLITKGDKGGNKGDTPDELTKTRIIEQQAAAKVLGVESVTFMGYEDGYLEPTLELRKEIVKVIRQFRPDIVVGCDPNNYFPRPNVINHPDHRAAGKTVVDAVFPAAGNYLFYEDLLIDGYEPVSVKELWLSIPINPNLTLDVTGFWQKKIEALHQHKSQIGDIAEFDKKMFNRRNPESSETNPKYEEKFYRICFETEE
jgi:LmbE family N-acetylglucosaminyl deacetylase